MPEQVNTSRVLLSTAEASELTGLSSRYIQRLLTEERIEGVKIGSVWTAYEDSLKAFMAQPRKRGPKGPHKKTEHDQVNPSPESRHVEVEHAEVEHAEKEIEHAGCGEAEARE